MEGVGILNACTMKVVPKSARTTVTTRLSKYSRSVDCFSIKEIQGSPHCFTPRRSSTLNGRPLVRRLFLFHRVLPIVSSLLFSTQPRTVSYDPGHWHRRPNTRLVESAMPAAAPVTAT